MGNEQTAPAVSGSRRALRTLGREVLLPIAVVIGLLLIAVALVEGPALDQFLYAVF